MDVFEIFRTLRRQYKLAIALALFCIALSAFAFFQIGSSYVSQTDIQILPNSNSNTENPLDKLNRNQVTVAEMLVLRLGSDSIRDEFAAEGLITDYEVDVSTDPTGTTSLPGIFGEVSGTRSGQVDRTLTKLIEVFERELEQYQKEIGAPENSWYQANVLTQDESPSLVSGSRLRSSFILAVLSVAFIVSTTLIVDGIRNGANDYRWLSRKFKRRKKEKTISLLESNNDFDNEELWINPSEQESEFENIDETVDK